MHEDNIIMNLDSNQLSVGFGCAPMLGRIGHSQSLTALSKAYELGIRHFDIARSYGWGEAEELLGEFLVRYPREEYKLVSKCGILPTPRSTVKTSIKKIGRQVYNHVPFSQRLVKNIASKSFQPKKTYDISVLNSSLEKSLKKLRTDYLDVLLLHNYNPNAPGLEEVISWFDKVKKDGKVKNYGLCIGSQFKETLEQLDPALFNNGLVIQTPVSDDIWSLPSKYKNVPVIVHSPFRYLTTKTFSNLLYSSVPNSDKDKENLFSEFSFLIAALHEKLNCQSLICSMFNTPHIEANCRAASQAIKFNSQEIDAFLKAIHNHQ